MVMIYDDFVGQEKKSKRKRSVWDDQSDNIPKPKASKKKQPCFLCGRKFSNEESLRAHILTRHDEWVREHARS